MVRRKKLPVGIDSFEKIIESDFYYIDKTLLIKEILENWGEVNLFLRPRRFGKTLNMNMLRCFFEIGGNQSVFGGLNIANEKALCEEYMGKFPVVSVCLKDVDGLTFDSACAAMRTVIGMEAMRFSFLRESEKLSKEEKVLYQQLINVDHQGKGMFDIPIDVVKASLRTLCALLRKHYGQKVILLIDEYDVPLDKAFQNGYYDEMVSLIRGMFSTALKSNEALKFAVLTGCLRVSRESIFTGLNNLKVLSITDARFDEFFGFTDEEVKELLAYYGVLDKFDEIKDWYDGYHFGNVSVYCPWDVISYCDDLCANPAARPKSYWVNTSSNSIVRRFIDKSTKKTQNEIEKLIAGEAVWKEIRQDITYNELDQSIDNLWSVLFTAGYLTQLDSDGENRFLLAIPNREIRQIFVKQIREWFQETVASDKSAVNEFCTAFLKGEANTAEELFTAYLKKTISIRDMSVPKFRKENFYHGILLGLFAHMEDWNVSSSAESGDGYSDILIEIEDESIGIVIEVKYGENGDLDGGCAQALKQIEEKNYAEALVDDGMETILKYGIACYNKRCKVVIGNRDN